MLPILTASLSTGHWVIQTNRNSLLCTRGTVHLITGKYLYHTGTRIILMLGSLSNRT